MRLLDVDSVLSTEHQPRLEEYLGHVPEYAILPHTWGADEVLFEDIEKGTARQRKGFRKLLYTARQAKEHDIKYIWVDTCCIDKPSSAELQEAINSMYAWYKVASICYAFLEDVASKSLDTFGKLDDANTLAVLSGARWFTRGWTLQELLAPRILIFFSAEWTCLGGLWNQEWSELIGREKDNFGLFPSLPAVVSDITGIEHDFLEGI
ncbi:hypothetical protein CLAFUW4_06364 [Fulvia fulva]|uniref:Vegetative incompatibility protein HET-E-1 n=1 Tax=Passalora fulva TaxID=5499 RepID=A0A9Q8LHY6_PASFU|nr:Vegetative incompatibility protein HET-E-1 [Fulvia fulva]KAK4623619.1 hypothetical protein CLAFUR4_06367 [Fulvia fulva]UJO17741.1 Vegetative incompatibility protein HET-E-1 [Fulvia fulva]WPV15279.1 hypothetical protein CLAFUW4_06364 [Fulvia fulva]WPV30371.1 hypothetical protein CLAFUW7_06362 [Fulvia fulva]